MRVKQRFLVRDPSNGRYLAYGAWGIYSTLNWREAYQFFNTDATWLAAMISLQRLRLVYVWPHQYEPMQRDYSNG